MFKKLKNLKKLLTMADKIAIICILVFSFGLIFLTPKLTAGGTENKDIVITLDSQEIYRYKLRDTSKLTKENFDFQFQGTNYQGTLNIKSGRVKLERLSEDISPRAIHAEMGWISQPHQMIVCLPVKLAITIESNNHEETDIDLRTF
jgi:hypothetical protein